MISSLSGARKASYAALLLSLFAAAHYHLGHALIAGLFAFMMLDQAHLALADAGLSPRAARWTSVALFIVVAGLLAVIFGAFIEIGAERFPLLLDHLLPRLDSWADRFGLSLPLDNVEEFRRMILHEVKTHAESITSTSGLLTRGFFQIVIAIVVAILRFVSGAPIDNGGDGLDERFFRECGDRAELFCASFERVMSAQIMIAAINAAAAAVFLFAAQIPFRTMLTLAAFICGIVPIVGNLVSNTLIVAAALTRSDHAAAAALAFLIVAHKGGYILYSRIVGSRIQTSTWAILLGLLIGEAVWGVTGVILAPTLIFYLREELRAVSTRA